MGRETRLMDQDCRMSNWNTEHEWPTVTGDIPNGHEGFFSFTHSLLFQLTSKVTPFNQVHIVKYFSFPGKSCKISFVYKI
jgi:hypothetical protein